MGIYATKSRWQRALAPLVDACVRYRIHPDWFIAAALAVTVLPVAAFVLAGRDHRWLWLAPPFLLLRLLLNLMDGQVARALGVASAWGEVKNEVADRVVDASVFGALALGGYADGRLVVLLVALILITSYLGIFGKAIGGPRLYSGIFGKGDRIISLALFTLYPALTGNLGSYRYYLPVAIVAAGVTIFQRMRALHGIARSAG